jgi:hypothetical protein
MLIPSINRLSILAGLLLIPASLLQAQTYIEVVDAGQTLPTAASTGAPPVSLTSITGNISSSIDADLFAITITNTTTFSATASSTAGIDTSLFLFNSSGTPVIANDDGSGTSLQAAIPAGNSLLTSLSPGTYFIGISLSGNEPVNLNNQLLFTLDQPTTVVRGMASGLNPKTLNTFNGNTSFPETGAYTITLTSTQGAINPFAVPEPSSVALVCAGIGSLLCLRRRTQKSLSSVSTSCASQEAKV